MLRRLRNRQRGFTLIELLIVVAIIGIIAAILIPNLIDALQKAKQKRSMADERDVGTAWMSWVIDQLAAGAAGQGQTYNWADLDQDITAAQLLSTLNPSSTFFYIQSVPDRDGWRNTFDYAWSGAVLDANVIGIRSPGRDGVYSGDSYTSGPFTPTDYPQDIVWANGYYVRWPGGAATGS